VIVIVYTGVVTCGIGGADALLKREVGFHATAEVFSATEANAIASEAAIRYATRFGKNCAITAGVRPTTVTNVYHTVHGGLCHCGA